MASAGARAYMGVWVFAPSGVQGQCPWSGGQGGRSPPEADDISEFKRVILSVKLEHITSKIQASQHLCTATRQLN